MTLWAPVVYGRTPSSDTWWRAVPEGLDQYGWLGDVVHSALSDGLELERRPRFLFARNATHRIVGVACQADDLSDTMWTDGSRKLFCFVGWAAAGTAEPEPEPDVPGLADLEEGYRQWAGRVYGEVLGQVWDAPATEFLAPVTTRPEPAPWPTRTRYPRPGPPPDEGAWAQDSWSVIWAAVQAARWPVTCVIGWQRISSARFENATHIGVADAPPRELPPAESPEPAIIPPAPKSPTSMPPAPAAPVKPSREPAWQPPSRLPADTVKVGAAADIASPKQLGSSPPGPVPRAGDHGHSAPGLPPREQRTPPGEPIPPVAGDRSWFGRIPAWAKLIGAAAAGALAAGLPVAIASPSPAPAPAPAGPPVNFQVVIPASDQRVADGLVDYGQDGTLSPGQSAAGMALLPSGAAAGPAACAAAVATTPVTATEAHQGLHLCIEFKGSPSRYGLLEITSPVPGPLTVMVTIWP